VLTSIATVATATPERYAKQLASHLGRKTEVLSEDAGQRIVLNAGSCLLESVDGALVLHASADDADGLQRVEQVVGSHLERFGARNELTVSWEAGS
jgi:hypothetical protein